MRAGGVFSALAAMLLLLAGCDPRPTGPATEGVTDALIANPPAGEWLSHGGDSREQRFSPLTQISDANVSQLGLAWSADMETARGQEATPLMHDGTLYVSTEWSIVKAFDARTGRLKWSYNPRVPRVTLDRACCGPVNRGVALYGTNVYIATLDGRLIALDQKTGGMKWSALVVPDVRNHTITGAPRIANGLVLIGSDGAASKARGFLAAYDHNSGQKIWRFHTVPGNPADGYEDEAMERAAKSWSGKWWEHGGGGTVSDAITYDPKTRLVLFATGTAGAQSPSLGEREGDALYTSSIVAVHADSGQYAWHFQKTAQDRRDDDSNAQITLADIAIGGRMRHVALHASDNGTLLVLDAASGELLSAAPYAPTTAPSRQVMSFSPMTALAYIPTSQSAAGALIAWNPAAQKRQWQVSGNARSGGSLATAGNLVFHGDAAGNLAAYGAGDGKPLWSFPVQAGGFGAPISYAIDGKQYMAVTLDASPKARLLVFTLKGTADRR